jgi:hypothetical protein
MAAHRFTIDASSPSYTEEENGQNVEEVDYEILSKRLEVP